MITINTENLTKVEPTHGVQPNELKHYSSVSEYLNKIHSRKQGFYEVIEDDSLISKINDFSKTVSAKFDNIVVLGIGGSSLGTICIQQSLTHLFENKPRLHVIDNIDPTLIRELEDVIDPQKTLFIVITKSGSTPETLAEYFYFREKAAKENFVFITDPEKGLLREIANKESITAFEVPPNVGGRFSVLTAVGLLPAKLIGVNIEQLVAGAEKMKESFLNEDPEQNLPFKLAQLQHILGQKGKIINVMMPYSQKLIRFADWYKQLLAESIGKKPDVGLTPVSALGATDQHSQSQLYNDGPNDKFFIFVRVENQGPEIRIPNPFPKKLDYLKNVSFNKLIHIEMEGTIQALTEKDRPNITINIDEVNAETLGGLFMLFEAATAFLGELYDIDAFNQPGVELSKQITKKLLLEQQ